MTGAGSIPAWLTLTQRDDMDNVTHSGRMWWILVYLNSCIDYIKENNPSVFRESALDQHYDELRELIAEGSNAYR